MSSFNRLNTTEEQIINQKIDQKKISGLELEKTIKFRKTEKRDMEDTAKLMLK